MPTETSPESAPGRRWVIGAVGHRYLPRERLPLLGAISRSLSELIGELDSEPADVMLLVSVAEGADRLFIEAAASLGMPYTCVLPCSPECFEADFDNHASVSEFRRFLAGAQDVLQPETDPVDRIAGYLWASHAIIDRASALIAVWMAARQMDRPEPAIRSRLR